MSESEQQKLEQLKRIADAAEPIGELASGITYLGYLAFIGAIGWVIMNMAGCV